MFQLIAVIVFSAMIIGAFTFLLFEKDKNYEEIMKMKKPKPDNNP